MTDYVSRFNLTERHLDLAKILKFGGLTVLGVMAIVGITVFQYGILPLLIGPWILAAMILWAGDRLCAVLRHRR